MTRGRLARTAWSVGNGLALPATGALVSLAAVRVAGVETWGGLVGAMLLVQLTAQIADLGSRDALVRAFSRDPASIRATWQTNVTSRAVLLALGPVAFLAAGVPPERAAWMTAWLVALYVARSHEALVAYRRRFGFAVGLELAATAATVGAVLWFGPALGVDGLVVVFAVIALGRAAATVVAFGLFRPWAWSGRFDIAELRRCVPFFALTFSGALGSRIDLYVVAALLSAADLGRYQVLTGLVLLIQALAPAVIAPVLPVLYRAGGRIGDRIAARLIVVGVPLTASGIVGAWLVLVWLYGIELPPSVLIAAWLATLPVFAYLPLVYRAYRDGRERTVVLANVGGIGVTLFGTVMLAPTMGIGGAMLAAAAGQLTVGGVLVVARPRAAPSDHRVEAPSALPGA